MKIDIERVLSSSNRGLVYLGYDGDRQVVIKRTHRDEATLLKQIQHKNIVKFISNYEEQGKISLVLEYVGDENLADSQIDSGQLRSYIKQVTEVLLFLHSKGIVYQNLHLRNILIHNGVIKLCGFSQVGQIHKLTNYSPPEILLGQQPSYQTDYWMLGCMICELLLQRPLFNGNDSQELFLSILKQLGSHQGIQIHIPIRPLISVFSSQVEYQLIDFIVKLLSYNKRSLSLSHPYFN